MSLCDAVKFWILLQDEESTADLISVAENLLKVCLSFIFCFMLSERIGPPEIVEIYVSIDPVLEI